MSLVVSRLQLWGKLVKFSHSVFALPFALSMVVIVARDRSVTLYDIALIVCAVVFARTAAMGVNRLLDRSIDAENPRTRGRELVTGSVKVKEAAVLVGVSTIGFLASAALVGWHCLVLAPLVLLVLFGYSYTKRFTSASHLVLGLALALAPGGAWYALTAEFAWEPVLLMAAVLFWVAGFDILYSCQDEEFDRATGLHSIPQRYGTRSAFRFAGGFHILTVALLFIFGAAMSLGAIYYLTVVLFGTLLIGQYLIVSPDDLEQIDVAFFSRNGVASVLYFIGVTVDYLVSSLI